VNDGVGTGAWIGVLLRRGLDLSAGQCRERSDVSVATQRGAPLETVIEAFPEPLMDRQAVPSGLGDRIGKKLPGVVQDDKAIRALFSAPPD